MIEGSTVIDYFRKFRCLVILDDVQDIFKTGELAGQYLTEYKDYGTFFKQLEKQVISRLAHQQQAIDISQQLADREFSKTDLLQAIQSLVRRGLVEKIFEGERSLFKLNPVFQQYIPKNSN